MKVTVMKILQEWMGKRGLLARLYICDGRVFLDYKLCRETTELLMINGTLVAQNADAPAKYVQYARQLLMHGQLF